MYSKIDLKEINLPETTFVRDVEDRVFQGIIFNCISKIEGITLCKGVFEGFWGRSEEKIKGIFIEQDLKKHSIYVRLELNISYGISIPSKAEEIQSKLTEEISSLTGLHVSCIHVVFKNLIQKEEPIESQIAEEYRSF